MSELRLSPGLRNVLPETGFSDKAKELLRDNPSKTGGAAPTGGASSASFLETLQSRLVEANDAVQGADKASQNFALGRGTDLHDVMIAMEKAEVAIRTVTAVRNKVVEAYQEIMKMPV